jgi:AcrR family transcriptional regulator
MDNASRSERTRTLALETALAIIVRDGPGRLTLDAIVRESGISKGGLMHQFPSKRAVLKALIERQVEHFAAFSRRYLDQHAGSAAPQLATQIATMRAALAGPGSLAFAILGAVTEEPSLLAPMKEGDAKTIAAIKAEAADPDLATVRWAAARGLLLTALLGLMPFPDAERDRLFDRLLDDRQWAHLAAPTPKRRTARRKKR